MDSVSKAWDWKQNTKDFWNIPSEESFYLLERWKQKDYQKILDLGCGLGRHSYLFAKNGFCVNSYDLSKDSIEIINNELKVNNLNIEAVSGDMINLPYENNSFDCLLAYHVISHTDTENIGKIIKEINRVLKKNGEFYITLCSKNSWSFKSAGYPKKDENTVIKNDLGPENGIPHFYCDDNTIKKLALPAFLWI